MKRRKHRNSLDKTVTMRSSDVHRLKKAYLHPWEKLKIFIDNYYANNEDEKPEGLILPELIDIESLKLDREYKVKCKV